MVSVNAEMFASCARAAMAKNADALAALDAEAKALKLEK